MERRESALKEALLKNSDETDRWEAYKKENECAIENLREFSKHLSVEVMVPVGKKAFMPGQLIHTNEVLVGHYQGYFSKCSAHKAAEICELRLRNAKEQLQKLETEAEFWQNKLDKPYLEGVLPNADEREIIEDYDEEQEKRWRDEHKIKVKRAKMNEKKEREKETMQQKQQQIESSEGEKSDRDILKMLEEAELVEELENELEKLEVDEITDETIRKLMTGEMELPNNKARTAHEPKVQSKSTDVSLSGVFKKTSPEISLKKSPATNNNIHVNPEINIASNEDQDSEDEDELPEEVRLIKEQAKFLPTNDQVGFYEYQVEIIRNKIANFRVSNQSDIEEKLHLLAVQAELEDLLALAEEEVDNIEYEDENNKENGEQPTEYKSAPTRRISFALDDETLIFRKTEAVSEMLPKQNTANEDDKLQRDIIVLDDDVRDSAGIIESNSLKDKKQRILERLEKNRKYIEENQSEQDCDLVSKIIDGATPTAKTIFIKFKHSEQLEASTNDAASRTELEDTGEIFAPGKPSDFYELYLKQQQEQLLKKVENIYVNSYVGEENVKAPILKEANRDILYEDPRIKFSEPNSSTANGETSVPTKSILRNKSAVQQETHFKNLAFNKKQKKKTASFDEEEYMSAYYKVMSDVIEKPLTEPDPLPQEKFIDAHAPKKRVSRFKQMRAEKENT